MKIAVIGADGQLGSELCRQHAQAVPLTLPEVNLTDPPSVATALASAAPEAVINAAAYTLVDRAESEPELCTAINDRAVAQLVKLCRQHDWPLVQLSTDYVFGGDRQRQTPYVESDPPHPLGVYARSKLAGEEHARSYARHLIVRTSGLYGRPGQGTATGNFVDTMLRLGRDRDVVRVVDDQVTSPSYVPHVARAILFLIQRPAYGTYHVANQGSTSWYGFAAEIFRLAGLKVRLEPISTAQYGAAAPRPAYSVLDTAKYRALASPPLPAWQEALAEYLTS